MSTGVAWWRLVAAREVSTRIRDKVFLISTGVLLALVLGGIVIGGLLGAGAPAYDVAVIDRAGAELVVGTEQQLRAQTGASGAAVTATEVVDEATARAAVDAERVDAALVPTGDGYALVGRDEVPPDLFAAASSALSLSVLRTNAEQTGTTVQRLTAGSMLIEDVTATDAVPADVVSGIGFVMALVFFMTSIAFGIAIAQSVVAEKENRIVEILAAALPVRALLWGKVAGNSLLALAQVLAVGVVAVVGVLIVGDLGTVPAVGVAGVWFVAFFAVGFLALASLWSVAGSLATRQQDLQATTVPGQVVLLVPYLVALSGNDRAIEIASFVPIASSMTMPVRLVAGDVAWWQPVVSLLLAAVAAALLIRLGARWYERTLLQTSRRTTYRELLRRPTGGVPRAAS